MLTKAIGMQAVRYAGWHGKCAYTIGRNQYLYVLRWIAAMVTCLDATIEGVLI